MKKLNAVLALFTTFLLIIHMVTMSLLAAGVIGFQIWFAIVGVVFTVVFSIHAILSIIIMMFMTERGDVLRYSSNSDTKKQRISAIIMLVLIHVHSMGKFFCQAGVSITKDPKMILLMIPELILIDAVCMHCGFSIRRALITLGITTSSESIRKTVLCSKIVFFTLEAMAMIATIVYAF